MKKFVFICILLIATPLYAQQIKTITLSDGSMIKGYVTSLADGIYTIESEKFGEIEVDEAEVVSITSGQITPQANAYPAAPQQYHPGASTTPNQLQAQVQQIQGQVLSDPQLMGQIMALTQDPEILEILKDPGFVDDVMSFDQERIIDNPDIQKLMDNPKMQNLMEQVESGTDQPY